MRLYVRVDKNLILAYNNSIVLYKIYIGRA